MHGVMTLVASLFTVLIFGVSLLLIVCAVLSGIFWGLYRCLPRTRKWIAMAKDLPAELGTSAAEAKRAWHACRAESRRHYGWRAWLGWAPDSATVRSKYIRYFILNERAGMTRSETMVATNRARQLREALPETDKQFLHWLEAALQVVSAYGKCIEETHMFLGSPVSKLPIDKSVIKQSILFLYSVIEHENVRSWIKGLYPDRAEAILSEKVFTSLREGYMFLPSFVSDEEFEILNKYQNKVDLLDMREILRDQGYDVVKDLMKMIADTNVLNIIIRMKTESIQYLRDLETYRDRFRHEVEKLQSP